MNTDPTAPPDPEAPDAVPATPAPVLPQPTGMVCGNCGTPLYGEHCYHCGQPVKGLVRRFSSVLGDIADTLFEIDTRLTRTVAPLLLRPGYLSVEYFAGRRVRYVSPVRLFFFISVFTFFVAQWSLDASGTQAFQVDNDGISGAQTVAEVQKHLDADVRALHMSKTHAAAVPGIADQMTAEEAKVRKEADKRIAELNAAKAAGLPPPAHDDVIIGDDDKPWDPVANPSHIESLPAWANKWLDGLAVRAKGNVVRIRQNPNLLIDAWLSALPTTLFLLMPLFAVLLKAAYLFKRRLYMEHFIVALHSHAFLCFALLLVLVCNGLQGVAATWMRMPLGWMQFLLIVWMPIYLLLMQKRVYQQGWIMTVLKFGSIGIAYTILLALGAALSLLVKFVWL
jgi:hypothetical protein